MVNSSRARRFRSTRRSGRGYIPFLTALLGCTVILLTVGHYYLVPALSAFRGASPAGRKLLASGAWLVLIVVLFVLLVIFSLSFRIGRLFFRTPGAPTRTHYSDAWAESAKRFQMPPDDESDQSSDASDR